MEHPPGPVVGRGPLGEGEAPRVTDARAVGEPVGLAPGDAAVAVPMECGVGAGEPWHAATTQAVTATTATTVCRLVIHPGIIRSGAPASAGTLDRLRATRPGAGAASGSAPDRVPDVLAAQQPQLAVQTHGHDVDPARLSAATGGLAEGVQEGPELGLLASVHRLLGKAVAVAPARLDLDRDQHPRLLADDVELAETAAPIARDDAQAARPEMSDGGLLPGSAHPLSSGNRERTRRVRRSPAPSPRPHPRSPGRSPPRPRPRRGRPPRSHRSRPRPGRGARRRPRLRPAGGAPGSGPACPPSHAGSTALPGARHRGGALRSGRCAANGA